MQAAETGTLKDEVPLNVFSCLNKTMYSLNTATEGAAAPGKPAYLQHALGACLLGGFEKCTECIDIIKPCSLYVCALPGRREGCPSNGWPQSCSNPGRRYFFTGTWKNWISSQANLERN